MADTYLFIDETIVQEILIQRLIIFRCGFSNRAQQYILYSSSFKTSTSVTVFTDAYTNFSTIHSTKQFHSPSPHKIHFPRTHYSLQHLCRISSSNNSPRRFVAICTRVFITIIHVCLRRYLRFGRPATLYCILSIHTHTGTIPPAPFYRERASERHVGGEKTCFFVSSGIERDRGRRWR